MDRLKEKIENDTPDGKFQNNFVIDNSKIAEILLLSYLMKSMKLILYIVTSTFFFAMCFKIIVDLEQEYYSEEYVESEVNNNDAVGFFQKAYNTDHQNYKEVAVMLIYFAFTSLTTVGFGDFNPKSNAERIMIALELLFGVAIFSYIMGNFIEILDSFKALTAEIDEGEELAKFFGILKKFNRNKNVKLDLKREIENFLEYKWDKDVISTFM